MKLIQGLHENYLQMRHKDPHLDAVSKMIFKISLLSGRF